MPDLPDRPRVLLLDVNETLLDLAPVKRALNDLLLDADGAAQWFSSLLHHSLVMTVADRHAEFTDIGAAVLQMLMRNRDAAIDPADAKRVLGGMRTLQPHPDVRPALERLRQAGYRLAALTNSSTAALQAQLEHAGLADLLERQLSVETLGRYKPHRAVYGWAAEQMGVAPAGCMMVAAHGWDVAGAQWAGLQAAFVARQGQQKFPLAPTPQIDVGDFGALADALHA